MPSPIHFGNMYAFHSKKPGTMATVIEELKDQHQVAAEDRVPIEVLQFAEEDLNFVPWSPETKRTKGSKEREIVALAITGRSLDEFRTGEERAGNHSNDSTLHDKIRNFLESAFQPQSKHAAMDAGRMLARIAMQQFDFKTGKTLPDKNK